MAEAVIWITAFAVPFAFIGVSHNTAAVKLPVFTALSGMLLLVSVFTFRKTISSIEAAFLILIPGCTLLCVRAPSDSAMTRLLLVSSACAAFFALRVSELRKERVLVPVIVGGVLALLASIFKSGDQERLAGFFGNANLLGSFAAALIPAGAALLTGLAGRRKLLLIPFLVIVIYALVQSGTRSSLIALPAGIAGTAALKKNPGFAAVVTAIFLSAVGFTALIPLQPGSLRPESLQVRRVIWNGAAEMFMERPVTGWGTGSFQREFPSFRDPDFQRYGVSTNTVHAHSEPLEILAENGLAGFLIIGTAFFLLLKRSAKKNSTLLEWGITASIMVLLFEGLASVALRWTTSVFMLAFLAGLLPGPERRVKHRFSASLVPVLLAITLLVSGGYTAYRITMSSAELGRAMEAYQEGESPEVIRQHCVSAIEWNGNELGAWYTLGNSWGLQAAAETGEERRSCCEMQLAAYDSLAERAPDFAWMRLNRIEPLIELEQYDRAMQDIIHVYRTRTAVREIVLETGYAIAPLASPENILVLMNLELSAVLQEQTSLGQESLRWSRVRNSVMTLYSVASVLCPEAIGTMAQDRDSILKPCGDPFVEALSRAALLEADLGPSGEALLRAALETGDGAAEAAARAVLEQGPYAPWHRAAILTFENGADLAEADDFVRVMEEPCRGFAHLFPGFPFNLEHAAGISAASGEPGHTERLVQYLLYACSADQSGANTYLRSGQATRYWSEVGGPLATAAGIQNDTTVWQALLNVPGSDAPEFRAARILAEASLVMTLDAAGSDSVAAVARRELDTVLTELIGLNGEGEGRRIFNASVGRVTFFFSSGFFAPETEQAAFLILSR